MFQGYIEITRLKELGKMLTWLSTSKDYKCQNTTEGNDCLIKTQDSA